MSKKPFFKDVVTPLEMVRLIIIGFIIVLFASVFMSAWTQTNLGGTDSQGHTFFIAGAIIIGVIAVIYGLVRAMRQRQLKAYEARLINNAKQQGWDTQKKPDSIMTFASATLFAIGTSVKKTDHYVRGDGWDYAMFHFAKQAHTKYGDYNRLWVHYSMMVTTLSRELPNVFFDSLRSGGKQFSKRFDKSQKITLEGDFNTYFDTYVPATYHIDSLSFITPEVMLILEAAADYDIEIIGNQLFIYGPLYLTADPLNEMRATLLKIRDALNDNIDTYRDNRLPVGADAMHVTAVGQKLKTRRVIAWGVWIVIIFYIVRLLADVLRGWFNS